MGLKHTKPKKPLSDEDKAAYWRKRFGDAGIKSRYTSMTMLNLGDGGKALRKYLQSDDYATDKEEGRGVFICGAGANRLQALPVFTKELIIMRDNARLLKLQELVWLLTSNDEALIALARVPVLCVDWFQPNAVDCPYTYPERNLVEMFLVDRAERGFRNCMSAHKRLADCDWWSNDFRLVTATEVREFSFGRI